MIKDARRTLAVGLVSLALWVPSLDGSSFPRGESRSGQVFASPQGRVENVRFERQGGGVINIYYDLSSDTVGARFSITIKVSEDGGKTFNFTPKAISGDITDVAAGAGKRIVWQSGKDVETIQFDLLKFEVVATSGKVLPALAGSLSVKTNPPGARVFVDEQQQPGQTPLVVSSLSPGTHRVRVEKTGFTEAGREIDLKVGQAETLDFTLKPAKREGRNPWVYILPIAGGGAAAALLLGNKGSEPPPPNTSPVPSGVTQILPDDGGVGLQGATVFRFSVAVSDPDGDPVTVTWDFNDGTAAATGLDVTHLYTTSNSFRVVATATDSRGAKATAEKVVQVKPMSGTWRGTFNTSPTVTFTLQILQAPDGTITGNYSDTAGNGSVVRSGISDVRNVSLLISRGNVTVDMDCKGDAAMNVCTGNVRSPYNTTLTMTRQ